jgi:hypothetical protein
MNPAESSAIFDDVFRACFNRFGKGGSAGVESVLLLFSDGENNAGQTTIDDAVRSCQESNTEFTTFIFPVLAPTRPARRTCVTSPLVPSDGCFLLTRASRKSGMISGR